MDYQKRYRDMFATLGYPLTPEDGTPDAEITAAEKRLGLCLPTALRDYYLVCGNERVFNQCHNHLWTPEVLILDRSYTKLIFMEENQGVAIWAVEPSDKKTEDPPVFQYCDSWGLEWDLDQSNVSTFLIVMLHWQAAWGFAMPFRAKTPVDSSLVTKLDQTWCFVGESFIAESNGMRAYSRQGEVACFSRFGEFCELCVGTKEESDLNKIALELGLEWKVWKEDSDPFD